MRNAILAGGLALISLIAPSCVDTAILDEVAAGAEEEGLLETAADEAPGSDAPDPLDVKLQHAAEATPTSDDPASRSKGTATATLVDTEANTNADTDEDSEDGEGGDGGEDGEDGDSSSVSGSGDGRVIVKK